MENRIAGLSEFLKILGDNTRLRILLLLERGQRDSKEIEESLQKSQSTISQQLKTLKQAKLIESHHNGAGARKTYSLRISKVMDLLRVIDQFLLSIEQDKMDELTTRDILDTLFS